MESLKRDFKANEIEWLFADLEGRSDFQKKRGIRFQPAKK